ncbi:MAG: hypothetical protein ABIG96_03490 [Candidatus Micrarchaeota archaeon]
MDSDVQLFWSGAYFLGLFLLWLSFYLISGPIKNLERVSGKSTHYKYILLALGFLVVRPLVDGYFNYFTGKPEGGLIDFASILAVLIGSILMFIPIVNLAKRSLSESMGMSTWLFYLQMSIVAFFFVTQIPVFFNQIASATYFITALILGMSLRMMSNFTEQFEIIFPLRWLFDTAAWVLPLALAIRAYSISVAIRFESFTVASYVSGELRSVFIFLMFVCGLMAFIGAYTLSKSVLQESAKKPDSLNA